MRFIEKSKNKKILIGTIIIIALGSGVFIFTKNNNKNDNTIKTENMIETYTIADNEKIFINGKIVPTESKDFNIPTEGEISKLNVDNGKLVKKGDLLFTTENESILNEIDSLKIQINDLEKSNSENDSIINSEINKLNSQISILNKKAYINTYAPFDGKIYLNEESNISDSSFMTLQSNTFYMKGITSEQDLSRLKIDDPAEVLILSTEQKIIGRISFISDRPTSSENMVGENSSLSYYDINISFENQENLVNGFHVQASIEIIDNLSKIPTSALVKTDDEVYVFKVIDGILKKQNVEIVSSNDELTVIKSGLDKNDIIVKYPIDNMKEGDPINFYNSDEGTDKAIE